MKSLHRKFMLGGIILGCGIFLFFLSWYDSYRISDIEKMSRIRMIHTSLERYYQTRAAYPPFADGPKEHGLSYRPLEKDGSLCQSKISCPWYTLEFSMSTNILLQQGIHSQTPTELK